MVDHLDQTERADRELNVVKRARFKTIETDKTNEFGVEPYTVKELPALPVRERLASESNPPCYSLLVVLRRTRD